MNISYKIILNSHLIQFARFDMWMCDSQIWITSANGIEPDQIDMSILELSEAIPIRSYFILPLSWNLELGRSRHYVMCSSRGQASETFVCPNLSLFITLPLLVYFVMHSIIQSIFCSRWWTFYCSFILYELYVDR